MPAADRPAGGWTEAQKTRPMRFRRFSARSLAQADVSMSQVGCHDLM